MSQLDNDKQTYIDYIKAVCETCGLENILNQMEKIKQLNLKELDGLSKKVEDIYNIHLDGKALDGILEEVEGFGADYVKEKYGLNKKAEFVEQKLFPKQ